MARSVLIWSVLAAALLAAPAIAAPDAARGLALARSHCAGCHAVGPTGGSPRPPAPPFRDLHARFPVADLINAIGQGAPTGHPVMPRFKLDFADVQDLIAYVSSVQTRAAESAEAARLVAGQRVAAQNCGACHAVASGRSPDPAAPAFDTLYRRPGWRGVEAALEEGMIADYPRKLEEGSAPMHPPMPRIELGLDEIANLGAYLESLQPPFRQHP